MEEFTLKLGNKEYKVTSTCSSHSQKQGESKNYVCSFDYGNIRANVEIKESAKLTRARAMLFVEALHVGINEAFKAQGIDQDWIWNKQV